jgi:catechol 2,3-dioxygenase-like lactoylglutathione lyase family enzyme
LDKGLTHIALAATDIDASIGFYAKYAAMKVIHDRTDDHKNHRVVWLSDETRPFVLVLIQADSPDPVLKPFAHLGVGVSSRDEVDHFADLAREDGVLLFEPIDDGPPVGYYIFLSDPDGHSLELSFGQEVGLACENIYKKTPE